MQSKSLCLFLHYSREEFFPLYVQYYLNELLQHFNEVRMITNKRDIKEEPVVLDSNIQMHFVENEGYDFGMFHKGFHYINPLEYSQIACVNDSNLLLNRLNFLFEWEKNQEVDFWGLVDSHEAPWFSTHSNNYHIQSHFIVFNRYAIATLPEFFERIEPAKIFQEQDHKQLRRKVINDWEIGVSQYLINKNLTSASFFSNRHLLRKYNTNGKNVTHALYAELLEEGYPLLKKKVVLQKSRNLFNRKKRPEKLIELYGCSDWNLEKALEEIL